LAAVSFGECGGAMSVQPEHAKATMAITSRDFMGNLS
jgi:hypothetical protein